MKRKEEDNKERKENKRSSKIWFFLLPIFILLLVGLLSIFLFRGCSNAKSYTFSDLIACLKESKEKYENGYSPLKDYFTSEVAFVNDENDIHYSLQYQKEPFQLSKTIKVGEKKEEYSYSQSEGKYYCNNDEVSEDNVQKEIKNEQCGYSYYLSLTLNHFDYLINSINEFKLLDDSAFISKVIEVSDFSTYSCLFEVKDEEENIHLLSFSFAKHNLENYREKTPLFSSENYFAFSPSNF